MKLFVFACVLVSVSAIYHDDYDYHHKYHGPKHYPIITKHGVPLETPEVIEAKIHHKIAHETAAHGNHYYEPGHLYHGSHYGYGAGYGYGGEYGHGYGHGLDYEHNKYYGPKHYPIITKSGVPLETPAVRDAKIHHHIAHEVAAHESGHYGGYYY